MTITHAIPIQRTPGLQLPQQGACADAEPELFYGPDAITPGVAGETGTERALRVAAAKSYCHRCPVQAECLAGALARREWHGVWGGLDEHEIDARLGRVRRKATPPRPCAYPGCAEPAEPRRRYCADLRHNQQKRP